MAEGIAPGESFNADPPDPQPADTSDAAGDVDPAGAEPVEQQEIARSVRVDPAEQVPGDVMQVGHQGADERWAWLAVGLIAAFAAVTYLWGASHQSLEVYYQAAVRSMSSSWHDFFYGAFDPRGTITVDKLPGALWVQALSVRVFGYHVWAIELPEVIEGVLTVLVLFRAVGRTAGPVAGVVAAGVMAVTPATVALARGNISDSLLILLLVLAANATVSAVLTGRARWLMLAGFWVGLAFQAKMLQAWFVLPAIVLAWLMAAHASTLRRILVATGAVLLAVVVSLSWMVAVSLQPQAGRPYVDGSSHDSVFQQVFVYNGFTRIDQSAPTGASGGADCSASPTTSAASWPAGSGTAPTGRAGSGGASGTAASGAGGAGGSAGVAVSGAGGSNSTPAHTGAAGRICRAGGSGNQSGFAGLVAFRLPNPAGIGRLLTGAGGRDIGWLLPLALVIAAALAWRNRRALWRDPLVAGAAFWAAWLVIHFLAFSFSSAGINAYYAAALAPAIAALAGIGVAAFGPALLTGDHHVGAVLSAVVAATVGYGVVLTWAARPAVRFPLIAAAAIVAVVAAVMLTTDQPAGEVGWQAGATRWWRPASLCVALVAVLILPLAGAIDIVHAGLGPFDTPYQRFAVTNVTQVEPRQALAGLEPGLPLLLRVNADDRYLAATDSSIIAAPLIVDTGKELEPIGGFLGSNRTPSLATIRHQIATGQVQTFIVTQRSDPRIEWIRKHCIAVPSATAPGTISTGTIITGIAIYACPPSSAAK